MERRRNRNRTSKSDSRRFREIINKFVRNHESLTLRKEDFNVLLKMYLDWRGSAYNLYGSSIPHCVFTGPQQAYSRKILLYIMERLFWTNVSDSRYVTRVLLFLYETEDDFLSIFAPPSDKCPTIGKAYRHLWTEYFLHHAQAKQMMVQGERMQNLIIHKPARRHFYWQPIEVAIIKLNPEVLRQILRYGAIAGEYSVVDFRHTNHLRHASKAFFAALNDVYLLNPMLLSSKELNLDPDEMCRYDNLLRCCNLILNEMSPRLSTLFRIRLLEFATFSIISEYPNFIEMLSMSATLPTLKKCLTEPLTLKHTCRLSIRKTLNIKWLLPHGIYKLPLPGSLQQYLDVQ